MYVYGATKLPKNESVPLFREALGLTIRRRREEKGIRLRELAKLASYSPAMISDAERGKKEINSYAIAAISKALDIKVSSIVGDAVLIISLAELGHDTGRVPAGRVL